MEEDDVAAAAAADAKIAKTTTTTRSKERERDYRDGELGLAQQQHRTNLWHSALGFRKYE
jgi:hypothetical protein